jgi:ribonuclease D
MHDDVKYLIKEDEVDAYIDSLRKKRGLEIALDIEGEFNLHRYGEHLSLIQIFDGTGTVVIDPLEVEQSSFAPVFEEPEIKKVIYDCSSDRTLLFRRYGITLKGVIDLLPAVELLQLQKRGLNNVLAQILGIELSQSKAYQRYDWMRRPLSKDALEYAVGDVHYLLPLKERLFEMVKEEGRFEEYQRINRELEQRPVKTEFVPGLFKKNRFKRMPGKQQEMMKKLFTIRDGYAREADLPPDRVISNETLFRLVVKPKEGRSCSINPRLSKESRERLREAFIAVLEK